MTAARKQPPAEYFEDAVAAFSRATLDLIALTDVSSDEKFIEDIFKNIRRLADLKETIEELQDKYQQEKDFFDIKVKDTIEGAIAKNLLFLDAAIQNKKCKIILLIIRFAIELGSSEWWEKQTRKEAITAIIKIPGDNNREKKVPSMVVDIYEITLKIGQPGSDFRKLFDDILTPINHYLKNRYRKLREHCPAFFREISQNRAFFYLGLKALNSADLNTLEQLTRGDTKRRPDLIRARICELGEKYYNYYYLREDQPENRLSYR